MRGFLEDASFNQSPPFGDVDLFSADKPLAEAAARCGLDAKALTACGKDYGSAETLDLGRVANENPPKLRTMDGKGNRIDFVEFHPAYHALMAKSIGWGIHSGAHDGSEPNAPLTSRAVRFYLATQAESGHLCSISMTHACIGALKSEPELLRKWQAKIVSRAYDRRPLPWWEKTGVTFGMGMTERQGGTDVRANITEAAPILSGNEGRHVEISGHKWFMSAPMCDAFLVLAQAQNSENGGGLTCYLMPRYRPDGSRNAIRFQRLKDKLGNKSNASSEVEFHGAYAERVGAEGAGVRTIIEMVNLTRIDCAIASAGQMRFGLSQALHHIRNRSVFQRRLADQPSMRAVVADIALELEAQIALVFRLAYAVDKGETAYSRLLTPAVKFLICKSTPHAVYESLECLGGNGYTEDLPMARLYREAPLNAIWEGPGNVMALDVLRAAGRAPDATMEMVGGLVRTASKAFDVRPLAVALEKTLKSPDAERRARFLCEGLARLAALAALAEANSPFATLYGDARLSGFQFSQYGAADLGTAETQLMDRALAA